MSEIESRHRKELKALEGEKRAALKKAKSTKGKKAKEAIASIEAEYDGKLKEMQERHKTEMFECTGGTSQGDEAEAAEGAIETTTVEEEPVNDQDDDNSDEIRQKKLEKARKKREKAKQKEKQRQLEIETETANAGPSPRDIEMEQIQTVLTPLRLTIEPVEADGHCLYRAVGNEIGQDYSAVRALAADTLQQHEPEFAPFCEYDEDDDFASYCTAVRNSANWGGHVELRALALALHRPIHVYSAATNVDPLIIDSSSSSSHAGNDDTPPIRLSYHLHYYSLGEHYNRVIEDKANIVDD